MTHQGYILFAILDGLFGASTFFLETYQASVSGKPWLVNLCTGFFHFYVINYYHIIPRSPISSQRCSFHRAVQGAEPGNMSDLPLSARWAVNAGHKSGAISREANSVPLRAASENGASRCANPVRQLKPESGCQ